MRRFGNIPKISNQGNTPKISNRVSPGARETRDAGTTGILRDPQPTGKLAARFPGTNLRRRGQHGTAFSQRFDCSARARQDASEGGSLPAGRLSQVDPTTPFTGRTFRIGNRSHGARVPP